MNVRGLSDQQKRRDVFNWLREQKYNIYCLQNFHGHIGRESHYRKATQKFNFLRRLTWQYTDESFTLLRQKESELLEIRSAKIKAVMIRSKSQYYEEGEKPTEYFFSLERKKLCQQNY